MTTLAATTLLMLLHRLLAHAASRSATASRLLKGQTVGMGSDGQLDRQAPRRHAVSQADLEKALRGAGLETSAGARLVVLEPSGKLGGRRPTLSPTNRQRTAHV